jgi:hypothetical protein
MAINPLPFLASMPDPGQAFMQSFQAARQQRLAQEQQAQQQQMYAQWIQRLQADPSAENMAAFSLQMPQESKAVEAVFSKLTAEQKKSRFNQSSTALQMLEAGDVESAKKYGQQILTAAKATAGQEEYAKALEYNLELLDKNPAAAKLGIAKSTYYLDPEGYKALYEKDSLTGFQKDLQAAGIDPTSEEGMAKARQFVELKTDPLVEMQTPDQGKFVGQRSEYYRRYGTGAPPPRIKQPPRVGEVRNGYAFTGGDPGVQSNWVKAKPLQETKAPELGAGGIPSVLTQAQYDAIVQVKGKGETDAWMLRNGVRIGGQ